MRHTNVTSSYIRSAAYNPQTREMQIVFHNAKVPVAFSYPGVDSKDYQEMMHAPSVGKYFHAFIKRKYKGTQIEVPV